MSRIRKDAQLPGAVRLGRTAFFCRARRRFGKPLGRTLTIPIDCVLSGRVLRRPPMTLTRRAPIGAAIAAPVPRHVRAPPGQLIVVAPAGLFRASIRWRSSIQSSHATYDLRTPTPRALRRNASLISLILCTRGRSNRQPTLRDWEKPSLDAATLARTTSPLTTRARAMEVNAIAVSQLGGHVP
jgi:hypothetical protein